MPKAHCKDVKVNFSELNDIMIFILELKDYCLNAAETW